MNMAQLDILEIAGRHSIIMSAHPLEKVEQKEEFPGVLRSFFADLNKLEVRAVTVLLPQEELLGNYKGTDLVKEYRRSGFEVLHFPLENFGTPRGIEVFDQLMSRLSEKLLKINVLIHCKTGCSRTAMVAAGVLIKLGSSAARAIMAVHSARPSSNLTINQIQFLREYQRYLSQK